MCIHCQGFKGRLSKGLWQPMARSLICGRNQHKQQKMKSEFRTNVAGDQPKILTKSNIDQWGNDNIKSKLFKPLDYWGVARTNGAMMKINQNSSNPWTNGA